MDKSTIRIHDNNLILSISSDGRIFQDQNGNPAFYKKGHEEINFLSSSGLIMYGTDIFSGRPLIVENNRLTDYLPHLHGGMRYGDGLSAFEDEVFKVTREDIFKHIEDFKDDGRIDHPIEDIFYWPSKGNSHMNSWDDELSVMNLAHFADLNENDIYEPHPGEYPALRNFSEGYVYRMPKEMYWFATTAKDGQFVNAPKVNVYHTIYVYDCEEDDLLYNAIFVDCGIYNYCQSNLYDFYINNIEKLDLACEEQVRLFSDPGFKSYHGYRDESCLSNDGYKPVLSRFTRSNIPWNDFPHGFQGQVDNVYAGVTGIRHYEHFLAQQSTIKESIEECKHVSQGF